MVASPLDAAARRDPAPPPLSETIEGGGRRPLSLDEGGYWMVESGYVDVFAALGAGRGRPGRRRHLFRCEAGTVLVGCRRDGGSDLALTAVGSLGSRLRPVASPGAAGLEAWILRISDAAAPEATFPEQVVEPGEVSLGDGRKLHADPGRLHWLEVLDGRCAVLGAAVLSPGDPPAPLAGRVWVTADGGLRARVSAQPPSDAAALEGARWIQCACLGSIERRLRDDAEAQGRNASVRRKSAERDLSQTFDDLAGIAGARRSSEVRLGTSPMTAALDALSLGVDVTRADVGGDPSGEIAPGTDPLEALLTELHLRKRGVVLADGWWRREGFAVLGRYGAERHPVALLPSARGWRAVGEGVDVAVTDATAARISADAVQVYRPLPREPLGLGDLVAFGRRGLGRDALRLLAAGLAAAVLALLAPAAAGLLFDHIVPSADLGGLWTVVLGLAAVAIGVGAFEVMKGVALLRLEARLDSGLQAALLDRLLRMPAQFFRGYSAGDLTDRALGIQGVREVLTGSTLGALLGAVFGLVSFGLMALYDVRLALIAFGLMLVAVAIEAALSYGQLREEREQLRHQGRLDGFVLQLLVGVSKLKAAAAEPRAMAQWARRFGDQKRRFVAARRWEAWQDTIQAGVPTLAFVALYAAIVWLAMADAKTDQLEALVATPGQAKPDGGFSTGSFIAFAAAFGQLLAAFSAMSQASSRALGAAPLLERARPILQTPPQIPKQAEPIGALTGAIELRRVSFRYTADGPVILNELDLSIPAGSYVAIVGPSGSGKSTIMRLLLGFERQETGEIFFDGKAAERLDMSALRRQMGVVLQHARITSGSLHENIIGATSLSLDDAWAAARLVGLDRDIEAMPMGMHTVLSDGGASLSGGQRQRLIIARALVNRPRILLLDEATSALDNRTQSIVADTLEKLSVTRIVIAHRLSTIRQVDRIFVLERGRLADSGAFDDLMGRSEAFDRLVRRQLL